MLELPPTAPRDALGEAINIGDRVAVASGASEIVIGTVIALVPKNGSGKPHVIWDSELKGFRASFAVKVRLEARGGRFGSKPTDKKTNTFDRPGRMVRIEKMDFDAFISGLRQTEEALRG